ncbi:MAG: response regulator [Phycisphaerales bacterium]
MSTDHPTNAAKAAEPPASASRTATATAARSPGGLAVRELAIVAVLAAFAVVGAVGAWVGSRSTDAVLESAMRVDSHGPGQSDQAHDEGHAAAIATVQLEAAASHRLFVGLGGIVIFMASASSVVLFRVRVSTRRSARLAKELEQANRLQGRQAERMRRDAAALASTLTELQDEKARADEALIQAKQQRDRAAGLVVELQESQTISVLAQHDAELERDRARRSAEEAAQAQAEAEEERNRAESVLAELQEERAVAILARHEAEVERDRVRVAMGDVESARLEAEMASRTKSLFIANMSHEIRTPMTAILGYAELLGDMSVGPAERTEHLEALRRSGQQLMTTIGDILEIGRIESGDLTSTIECCGPRELAEQVVELLGESASKKGLELAFAFDDDVPDGIRVDPRGLRHALSAIIGNAIKFTEAGGVQVKVSTAADANQLVDDASTGSIRMIWTIQDSGPGVPDEARERIFEPFTQCEVSMSRTHGGTGLGLTIAKRVAETLGGDLRYQDPAATNDAGAGERDGNETKIRAAGGPGSAFVLEFPAEGAMADDVQSLPIDDDDRFRALSAAGVITNTGTGDEAANAADPDEAHAGGVVGSPSASPCLKSSEAEAKTNSKDVPGASPAPNSGAKRPLEGRRVLIVEDGVDNRRLLGFHMKRAGAVVEMAVDGREGVDRFMAAQDEGDPFDLVLMDMQMPVLDGYGATRELRDRGFEIPVIAVTAHAASGDREECLAAGCDDYATKPIDAGGLVARCLEQLDRAAA